MLALLVVNVAGFDTNTDIHSGYFSEFFTIVNTWLSIEYHFHIWQLSQGDTF